MRSRNSFSEIMSLASEVLFDHRSDLGATQPGMVTKWKIAQLVCTVQERKY